MPDFAQPTPDLPCGGADLQTDADNCGECGNECLVVGAGDYEVGGCVDGGCGPTWWSNPWLETDGLTCADVCAEYGLACQSDACAGLTGFVCEFPFGATACATIAEGEIPLAEIEGQCSNQVVWPEKPHPDSELSLYCCCG